MVGWPEHFAFLSWEIAERPPAKKPPPNLCGWFQSTATVHINLAAASLLATTRSLAEEDLVKVWSERVLSVMCGHVS